MTVFGYARVSTLGQTLEAQIAQLAEAGCASIVREKASGANLARPQLRRLCRRLKTGDVIVVTRIDRFARSARDLLNLVSTVRDQGAAFRSLAESWDTSTPVGQLMLTVLAGIAEYEREIIRARTLEGRHLAKMKGVRFGRPPKLNPGQRDLALKRAEAGESQLVIASSLGVSYSTISRIVSRESRLLGAG
jgi:DNA invertase Pin-like site-specific DNA recombinase